MKAEIHQVLRKLAHEEDLVVIMVSSEEEEILEVSDEVIVFANGKVVGGPSSVDDVTVASLRQTAWGNS